MFIIHKDDNSVVSQGDDTNPIFLELDSTDADPSPKIEKYYLLLPAGNVCLKDGLAGGATIEAEGTTANYWTVTEDDPVLVINPNWQTSIRVDVENNIPTEFWIKAETIFGEVPVDDRTVAIKVSGKVEKI